MPTKRPKPRFPVLWLPAIAAGSLAVGLAVWGATHQGAPPDAGSPAPPVSDSSSSSSPTPSASPDPTVSPSGEPVAIGSRLRSALVSWREADTGGFSQTSVIPGIGRLSVMGVYQLSARSSEATQVFTAEDAEPVEIRFLGTEEGRYLNSPSWRPEIRRCWMRFDERVLAESTGIAMVNGAGRLPANVLALSEAKALRAHPTDPEVVIGTVSLAGAAPLFGSGLVKALRDPDLPAPVVAEFRLVDDELAGWRVRGRSLATVLRREQALTEPNGVLLAAISSYAVEVEYDAVGATEVDVRPPAPALRMTQEQAQSGVGCPGA